MMSTPPATSSLISRPSAAPLLRLRTRGSGVYVLTARSVHQGGLAPDHRIDQLADLRDADADLIAGLQGERKVRDETGPGGQDRARRELLLAEEVLSQLVDAAPQPGGARLAFPGDRPVPGDGHLHGERIGIRDLPRGPDPGSERTATQ